jgi:acetoin utilization protein AcuB
MRVPTVADFMTPTPDSVPRGSSIAQAHRLMKERQIRHLPVMDGEELVGVISHRDLHLFTTLRGLYEDDVTVDETMSQAVFRVPPDAPLERVAIHMWQHKLGSAVVVEQQKVVGIFTTTDALKAIIELLASIRRGELGDRYGGGAADEAPT